MLDRSSAIVSVMGPWVSQLSDVEKPRLVIWCQVLPWGRTRRWVRNVGWNVRVKYVVPKDHQPGGRIWDVQRGFVFDMSIF